MGMEARVFVLLRDVPSWRYAHSSNGTLRSQNARSLVVDLASLQSPEFQEERRKLGRVPGREHGVAEHRHRCPSKHPARTDDLEQGLVGEAGIFRKPTPEVEEPFERRIARE